jgi:ElaB/YqjD/DUF883 family membrane-anchored ribosome-binding protein
MPSTLEPTVEELREESERSREALACTVGELRDTVGNTAAELKTIISPAHIKKEIRNYVRAERESMVQSIQRRAQDNPLQMAAVGAAVAYPVWSLLRAIPTPLLLIGAGLFLTSKRGQQSANEIKAKVDDAAHQGTEKVSDLAGAVRSDLEDRLAGARYGAEEIRDTVTSAASAVTGKVTSVTGATTDKARAVFHDAADTAKGTLGSAKSAMGGAADQVASAAEGFSATASETAESAKDQATAAGRRSRDTLTNFVDDNPLLVAGIGAAVGAFIAASIPSSDAENTMFGTGSEKLKGGAREAAAQGIEQAGNIAAEAAGSVATAAAREGLDATGVQRALNTVADSVRKVADRGLETALGATAQSGQQPNGQQPNLQRNAR